MATPRLILNLLLPLAVAVAGSFSKDLPIFNAGGGTEAWEEALHRDEERSLFLNTLAVSGGGKGKKTSLPIASGQQLVQSTTYVVPAGIGTPPQPLLVSLDTGTDASWLPCTGCSGCPDPASAFSPQKSATYKPLPCTDPRCSLYPNHSCSPSCAFNLSYAGSTVAAAASVDALTIATASLPGFAFGCMTNVTGVGGGVPSQGVFGLGRGPSSLTSQTKGMYDETFSYCLPSFRSTNFSGSLRLGRAGQPVNIKTSPVLSNPRRPSLYYVTLRGVLVGRRMVAIPPGDPATGAGTVVDIGTMFTRLVAPAYEAVRDEFRRRVGAAVTSLGGFDTCFDGPVAAPPVTLVFDGMNVTLPPENVMIHSTAGSRSCLAMAAATADNVNSVVNVVASFQQQNHRVLVDVPGARVGFAREPCTAP